MVVIPTDKGAILELRWNPGENLVLAAHKDGLMILYNIEDRRKVNSFEKAPQEISDYHWLDNVSGDFVTSSAKVGALRLWNASQASSKDVLKVAPQGIIGMCSVPGSSATFILQLKSGQIILYDVRKRRVLF